MYLDGLISSKISVVKDSSPSTLFSHISKTKQFMKYTWKTPRKNFNYYTECDIPLAKGAI